MAAEDVGKAAVSMILDPETSGTGQILHAISCICKGSIAL